MFSLRGIIGSIAIRLFGVFPLQNKIVFSCFDGKTFGDNPKAVYDYMLKENVRTKYIWLMYNKNKYIEGAEVVKAYSLMALYHQATAKVWVFNSRQRSWMVKRKKQTYIQTWHAGVTMKKVEQDAVEKLPAYYIEEAKHDSEMIDYLISASKWNTDNYLNSFWYHGEILEIGSPRSDVFFKNSTMIKEKVYSSLGIDGDIHTVLYAPTFRNNGSIDCYDMDIDALTNALIKKWGAQWKVIVRLHPNIQAKVLDHNFGDKSIDGSTYPDINELIIASEMLITDYSSCMFDALEIGRKVVLYTPDIKEYFDERGTYFDFSELPMTKAENNTELVEAIISFDEDEFFRETKVFMDSCGSFNDGTASKKITEIIKKALL